MNSGLFFLNKLSLLIEIQMNTVMIENNESSF